MGGNSLGASGSAVGSQRAGAKRRAFRQGPVGEAVDEAQAIASAAFGGEDRSELVARANYLALFLWQLDEEGRDLEFSVALRPIWNTRIEVPLCEAPAMLRSLLNAA